MNVRRFRVRLATPIALVISLLLFLPAPAAIADAPFSSASPITTTFTDPRAIHTADIDGDGDLDAAGVALSTDTVAWFENTSGNSSSWIIHIVDNTFDGAESIYAADLDGDGDADLLGAAYNTNNVAWFENTAGDGSAWLRHIVSASVGGAMSVHAADLDHDGDLDVLTAAGAADTIAWFENTAGDGSAWTPHTVSSGFDGAARVYAADVDGDGDSDILGAAEWGDAIAWWENTAGDGSAWTTHTVSAAFDGARSVYPADLDRDGDLDLIGAANLADTIAWFENTTGDGSAWTQHTLSAAFDYAISAHAADLDGDGDLDVLGAAYSTAAVAWWDNTAGDGSAWTQRSLGGALSNAYKVHTADLDGDGDADILTVMPSSNTIIWWRNDTIHRTAAYPAAGMHTVESAFNGANSLYAADIDVDGDLDLLGSKYNDGAIAWWDNTAGDGSAWTARAVGAPTNPRALYAADMDGDGDPDVLGGWWYLDWWENTSGNGTTWSQHTIDNSFAAYSIHAGDVDGDGDLDLIGAHYEGNSIAWFENTAGDGSAWTTHTVSGAFAGACSVHGADLDGDGDLDLIGGMWSGGSVAWWENTAGDGSAWTQHAVDGAFSAHSLNSADLDADGDLDLLGASTGAVAWWDNTAGDGSAWTAHTLPLAYAASVSAPDLDGDGDLDLLSAGDNLIAWFENTAGDGSAWTQHTVTGAFDGSQAACAADLDGDGDLDAAGAAWIAGIAWWENMGGQFALAAADTAPAEIVSGLADDVLQVTMTHLGRPGDGDEEWATAALLFEDEFGYPLDDVLVNNLIDTLEIYLDDGSGAFEPAADTLVTTVDTLVLVNGVQTVAFADGDPNVQVAYSAPRTYFVVVRPAPSAWYQLISDFRVTHLTDPAGPAGTAEHRNYDLGLALEYAPNTASGLVSPGALADLAIAKTAGSGVVAPGQALTYTLVYTNYGPSAADYYALGPTGTIFITDSVPAALTNVAYAASDPALTLWPGSAYTWWLWHLEPGQGGIITITGVVDPALSAPQPITNSAAISAYPPDPAPANNSASTTGVVEIPIAGLTLETSSPTPFGQPTIFTATVAAGSNLVFTWDWGDGVKSALGAPALDETVVVSHTYAAAGSYTAAVTAANAVGSAVQSAPVEVVAPPACVTPVTGVSLAGLPQAYVDLTWFFTATVQPAGPTAPITYTWSPDPAGGQGAAVAAYSWAATGPVTITVLAQNCGGMASASFAIDVMSEITTPIDPGMTTTIVYTDPQMVTTTVIVPPGATPVSITLVFAPNPTPTYPISDGLAFAGRSFDLDAYLGQQPLPGFVFSQPISIGISYTDEDIAAIQEADLKLYYWTGTAWADGATTCSPPSAYSHDLALNRIAVEICHLTEWNIQGPESLKIVYLPLILKGWATAPDLVIERIGASADDVRVVVRNQGASPVTAEFWVDLYVTPSPPPTRANQTWDQLGDQGLVWGVDGRALPLAPGEAITLTVGDPYFWAEYSHVAWPLPAGALLYAQVDSAGDLAYGGVLELDEIRSEPYNNIAGPVYSIPDRRRVAPAVAPPAGGFHLPPR